MVGSRESEENLRQWVNWFRNTYIPALVARSASDTVKKSGPDDEGKTGLQRKQEEFETELATLFGFSTLQEFIDAFDNGIGTFKIETIQRNENKNEIMALLDFDGMKQFYSLVEHLENLNRANKIQEIARAAAAPIRQTMRIAENVTQPAGSLINIAFTNPSADINLGQLITEYRTHEGITQKALADRLGVNSDIIQQLEAGEILSILSIHFNALKETLGLSVEGAKNFANIAVQNLLTTWLRSGITESELADSAEISYASVRKFEKGKHIGNLYRYVTPFANKLGLSSEQKENFRELIIPKDIALISRALREPIPDDITPEDFLRSIRRRSGLTQTELTRLLRYDSDALAVLRRTRSGMPSGMPQGQLLNFIPNSPIIVRFETGASQISQEYFKYITRVKELGLSPQELGVFAKILNRSTFQITDMPNTNLQPPSPPKKLPKTGKPPPQME